MTSARSAFPRSQWTGYGSSRSRASTSSGSGPAAMSPPTTTASGSSALNCSSTASSAGRLPWMSQSTATLTTGLSWLALAGDPIGERLNVLTQDRGGLLRIAGRDRLQDRHVGRGHVREVVDVLDQR